MKSLWVVVIVSLLSLGIGEASPEVKPLTNDQLVEIVKDSKQPLLDRAFALDTLLDRPVEERVIVELYNDFKADVADYLADVYGISVDRATRYLEAVEHYVTKVL